MALDCGHVGRMSGTCRAATTPRLASPRTRAVLGSAVPPIFDPGQKSPLRHVVVLSYHGYSNICSESEHPASVWLRHERRLLLARSLVMVTDAQPIAVHDRTIEDNAQLVSQQCAGIFECLQHATGRRILTQRVDAQAHELCQGVAQRWSGGDQPCVPLVETLRLIDAHGDDRITRRVDDPAICATGFCAPGTR